jgi:hypothetical protein
MKVEVTGWPAEFVKNVALPIFSKLIQNFQRIKSSPIYMDTFDFSEKLPKKTFAL